MANKLLGRTYAIEGRVIPGQGLGKRSLVPTLNLKVEHYQLPLEGVYATRTQIGSSRYPSVSFLGHRVSTDGSFAVETHILDKDIGSVEGEIVLEFVALIRPNRKFDTLEALKEQIKKDIESAGSLLSQTALD